MGPPEIVPWCEQDLHAWQVLRPVLDAGGYLPWSAGSMRPAGLVAVCNEVVHGGRTRVLELGAGVSTVVLARLLRARGAGGVVALEHDPHWAAVVRDLLAAEGLGDVARVERVPLRPWYQLAGVPGAVDLLLVDGPPALSGGGERAREPALPALDGRLVPGAVVVLDDIARAGERAVVASWEAQTPWRFEVDDAAGVAIGRRQAAAPASASKASSSA